MTLLRHTLVLLVALTTLAAPGNAADAGNRTTLVWISLDGIRPDYLDRADTPFFDRMTAQGAWSRKHTPLFPTLTFPAHVTLATGRPAGEHGIVANAFYDNRRDRSYGYPNFTWLLEAEPIWTAASRQGVTTAVFGWPLSHRQRGKPRARYFDETFDKELSDRQRLFHLLDTWRQHEEPHPLRLLMGYGIGPDTAGHRYGPDAPETAQAMAEADQLMAAFEEGMLMLWNARRQPNDTLFLLITSDHGMSPVHTLVNLRRCAGLPARSPVRLATGGNIGHIFFNRIDNPNERHSLKKNVLVQLSRQPFIKTYERDSLPAPWRYHHPHRTGDWVAVLPPGYTFNGRIRQDTLPASEAGEPLGMHGYCPKANPDMITVAFIQRYPEPLGGHGLGAVDSDQWHATAARLLGIEPSTGARTDPIAIPGLLPGENTP